MSDDSTKRAKGRGWWPSIETELEAKKAADQGAGAAVFVAGVGTLFSILAIFDIRVLPGYSPLSIIDAGVFAIVAWRIYRMSRAWALVGLLGYIYELAYSVYLHVGLEKNWIMQYSLPRAADSANAGTAHLDAPWPYYIVRPNLNPDDATSDSVMVHGFVNESGHFEKLTVVFPTDMGYAREQLVLNALQQWQFRAGAHDGQVAKLEVLLIIPEISQ